jgi:hypothetical protein
MIAMLKMYPGGFNGATPLQAWKPSTQAEVKPAATLLQWGHASSSVETIVFH